MMKICRYSGEEFKITYEDRRFYEMLNVPEPTLCPDERSRRRLAYRNERSLYKRKCDLSCESIIAMYPDDSPYRVYSNAAWHSDMWDAIDYGRDFDFSRNFFEQFKELQLAVPRVALMATNNENCPYVNQTWFDKNCHLCFDVGFCEDAMFCVAAYHSRDIFDCSFVRECELSYWLIDCVRCYQSFYLQDCENCHDAFFSFDCNGCSRVAFCANLRGVENYIFDQKVSKDEFDKFVEDLDWERAVLRFYNEVLKKAMRRENHNINCENCVGDYLLNSKNCFKCFDCDNCEDLRYCNRMDEKILNSMDLDNASHAQLSYESLSTAGYGILFSINSYHPANRDLVYTDTMKNCSDCFGCSNMQNKRFCIFNKQYSESEYRDLMSKIIEHMKKTGEWGEFFPLENSPFSYNEAAVQEFFPMEKADVLKNGWRWREPDTKEYLPAGDDLLACCECGKNYKLLDSEVLFYERFGLSAPKKCNSCRHLKRVKLRTPRRFFDRNCCKCGNQLVTGHGGKVYCDQCYLAELY